MTQGRKAKGDSSPDSLYLHCLTTYKAMMSSAQGRVRFNDSTQENETIVVWEGMLTQFITGELHLSVPYYTYITRALKRMGCIEQLKRGGGTAPSQWRLITEPTEELFQNSKPPRKAPATSKDEQYRGELNAMNKRLSKLEQAFEKVIEEEVNQA